MFSQVGKAVGNRDIQDDPIFNRPKLGGKYPVTITWITVGGAPNTFFVCGPLLCQFSKYSNRCSARIKFCAYCISILLSSYGIPAKDVTTTLQRREVGFYGRNAVFGDSFRRPALGPLHRAHRARLAKQEDFVVTHAENLS